MVVYYTVGNRCYQRKVGLYFNSSDATFCEQTPSGDSRRQSSASDERKCAILVNG